MSSAFEGLPKTPNLKLNKPGYDNVADIEVLNENADILDDEITTIKSNLKNKGSATEPVYFDDSGVPQKTKNFNDYLPLNGGVMTGDIKASDSINSFVVGYNYDSNKGALIALRGTTYNTNLGGIELITTDGSNKKTLAIKSDGTLKWDNKEIYHSGKTIPISNGGTGATTAEQARENLGLGNVATLNTVPIANGGTGATTAKQARENLGLNTAVTGASISGQLITLTFADGTTKTLTTQDTNTNNISAQSLGTNGYIKFNNGLIIQWGKVTNAGRGVTFPVAFASAVYTIVTSYQGGGSTSSAYYGLWCVKSYTLSGFTMQDSNGNQINYVAFGK